MDGVLGRTGQGRERVKPGNAEEEGIQAWHGGAGCTCSMHTLHERHFLNKNNSREHESPQQMPAVTVSLRAGPVPLLRTCCALVSDTWLHISAAGSRRPFPRHLAPKGSRGQVLGGCQAVEFLSVKPEQSC